MIAVTGAAIVFARLPSASAGSSFAFASALRTKTMRIGCEFADVGPMRAISKAARSISSGTSRVSSRAVGVRAARNRRSSESSSTRSTRSWSAANSARARARAASSVMFVPPGTGSWNRRPPVPARARDAGARRPARWLGWRGRRPAAPRRRRARASPGKYSDRAAARGTMPLARRRPSRPSERSRLVATGRRVSYIAPHRPAGPGPPGSPCGRVRRARPLRRLRRVVRLARRRRLPQQEE